MNKTRGIIVFGANGSGKTTLARELANLLGFKHMDIEDYFFEPSEIPYTAKRPHEDFLNLMLADIEKHGSFVISAVTGDLGEKIPLMYDLGVFIYAPKEIRMNRIEQRGLEMHGARVCKGGDMYEQQQRFMDFAANRPLEKIDEWAKTLVCPVVSIDGTADRHISAAKIANHFRDKIIS